MAAYKMHLYDVVSIEETSFEHKKRDTPMGDQVTQETAASLELDDTSTNSESQAKETERKGKGKIPEGKSVSTRGKTVSLSQATNLS